MYNIDLFAILYQKSKNQEHLSEEDFIRFRERGILCECEYKKDVEFHLMAADTDLPYGALFYVNQGKFIYGQAIPFDSMVFPHQIFKPCDKVYYTDNIRVYKYDKLRQYYPIIKIILWVIIAVVLMFSFYEISVLKTIWLFPIGAAVAFTLYALIRIFHFDKKSFKLKADGGNYFALGEKEQELKEYCYRKEHGCFYPYENKE